MSKLQKAVFKGNGLEVRQAWGPFVELYFDWNRFPPLDLKTHYYLVEIAPEPDTLPVEYARPNSDGPLHFCLKTGVQYQLRLISVPYPLFEVSSDIAQEPQVRLVPQHENMVKLVAGEECVAKMQQQAGSDGIEIIQDGKSIAHCESAVEIVQELAGRPEMVEIRGDAGQSLVIIKTNLQQKTVVETMSFNLAGSAPRLSFSTAVNPVPGWRVRAELPTNFRSDEHWRGVFLEAWPDSEPAHIIGCFRFFENSSPVDEVRQLGYSTRVNLQVIEQIQLQEWKQKKPRPLRELKLQLQITSAHRELYRYVLLEKCVAAPELESVVGFEPEELVAAERALFNIDRHVSWDHAFLEVVLWFKADGRDWQEFQRDNAHSLRWDYLPGQGAENCSCEWVLSDITRPERSLVAASSGVETRVDWPARVYLRPFSQKHLFACWDLDQEAVRQKVEASWGVDLNDVGFYLKVHEEFLGERKRRSDLDAHLVSLFSEHRSIYFDVDPDKCFSVEIVARHKAAELALTPVSKPIITPRISSDTAGGCNFEQIKSQHHHCSQREVRHEQGGDAGNKARVMLHLHMHSPNLYRADPFRERFLRDGTWPTVTHEGAEVHNPPGEWVLKNCLDSWLPILRVLRSLAAQSVDYQVSLDISPPVAYMISSPWFKDYFSRYLLRAKAYIDGQIARMAFRREAEGYLAAAGQYRVDLDAIEAFYVQELNKDIIGAFRELELQGYIEISTCTATHGMPAELESVPDALNSQIILATRSHHRIFGDRPRGIWLAENSFFPGVEHYLAQEGLGYFFVEAEAVLAASEPPAEEEFNPVILPESGVVAFGRSRLGRTRVWDAEIGYAGHPDFREYHFRHFGLPIKRIMSKGSDDKQPYDTIKAEATARELACDFFRTLRAKAEELGQREFKSIPLITCSYDAELFGHHWSEGPVFLEEFLREFYRNGDTIGLTTPSHYLADDPVLPRTIPNPSTWGHEALHVKWSDPKVSWTFREIERADWILREYLAKGLKNELTDLQLQLVEQMAAEFIRMQSSDLTFVIMAGDFEEDMQREILKYLDYFYRLKFLVDNNINDESFLEFRLYENGMFPEIPQYYAIRDTDNLPE